MQTGKFPILWIELVMSISQALMGHCNVDVWREEDIILFSLEFHRNFRRNWVDSDLVFILICDAIFPHSCWPSRSVCMSQFLLNYFTLNTSNLDISKSTTIIELNTIFTLTWFLKIETTNTNITSAQSGLRNNYPMVTK